MHLTEAMKKVGQETIRNFVVEHYLTDLQLSVEVFKGLPEMVVFEMERERERQSDGNET